MFHRDKWPFIPIRLSEIIVEDELSVILTGCSERLGRAITVIDADRQTGDVVRIESINAMQHFEVFCAFFRDDELLRGGNEACEYCDEQAAKASLRGHNRSPYRDFRCHIGLLDATHTIQVYGQPIAVLFTGQFRPPEGIEQTQKNVRSLGTGRYKRIELLDEMIGEELLSLSAELPSAPDDFQKRLNREAEHIQKIAQAEYQRVKSLWEQEFLDKLRAFGGCNAITDLEGLRHCTSHLLQQVQDFCRCDYVIFFASIHENDTVLASIAQVGVPRGTKQKLPHFNWKKAGPDLENFSHTKRGIARQQKEAVKGIRGDNSRFFSEAACVLPTKLGNRYRGALVFGPFAEQVDLSRERRFLKEITNIVGATYVLAGLEVLNLQQERQQWESTARLLTHQLRTSLTPITAQVGSAHLLIQILEQNAMTQEAIDTLKRAENLCMQLGERAPQTIRAHTLLLEADDLRFETYPLSVLVANCVEGFALEAEKRGRHLIIDKSVELLPEARIDVNRLIIALNNLIENALKYSYPHTKIFVRSRVDLTGGIDLVAAVIEVDDLGDAVRTADRKRIFEQGARGLTQAKMGRIPGSGLGLWETRAVVEAHGGTITVSSEPTSRRLRQGQAHRVVFSIRIPLKQR